MLGWYFPSMVLSKSLKWYFPSIYLLIATKDIVGMVQCWYYPKCGVMPFCCLNGCSIYITTVNIPQITTLVEHKRQKCAKFQLSTTSRLASEDMAMQGVKKKVVNYLTVLSRYSKSAWISHFRESAPARSCQYFGNQHRQKQPNPWIRKIKESFRSI